MLKLEFVLQQVFFVFGSKMWYLVIIILDITFLLLVCYIIA